MKLSNAIALKERLKKEFEKLQRNMMFQLFIQWQLKKLINEVVKKQMEK